MYLVIDLYEHSFGEDYVCYMAFGDNKKKKAKIRYDRTGNPFFRAFGYQRFNLDQFVKTDSPFGHKHLRKLGVIARGQF